jgi:beta-lactam-binding protein with PASTA domain
MKKIGIVMIVALLLSVCGTVAFGASDEKGTVQSAYVIVPNVVGKTLVSGMSALSAVGLRAETQLSDRDGERRIIIRQDPAPGTRVAKGSFVKIYGQLADEKGRVTLPPR